VELAATASDANERIDKARCTAADELNAEVFARKQAFAASDASREALGANMREELKHAMDEASSQTRSLTAAAQSRIDAANEDIRCLERSFEKAGKEHSDSWTSLRNQLRVERQRTEEADTEAAKNLAHVRDTLESRILAEVHELRESVGECKKKMYEETNTLRKELRQQPSKKEVAEVAASSTEQYNELLAALDGHRNRLETSVADFNTRCREVRNESTEARLRNQRETMALGHEMSQLRAACTSLANGTMKALQVIGFIREDIDVASDATKRSDAKPLETPRGGANNAGFVRGIEVEDLLEWEKVGKSLSARIARQWQPKESKGTPTILSLIEQKADCEELVVLKTLYRECTTGAFSTIMASDSSLLTAPVAGKFDAGSLMKQPAGKTNRA
jgi:hypothetical protein